MGLEVADVLRMFELKDALEQALDSEQMEFLMEMLNESAAKEESIKMLLESNDQYKGMLEKYQREFNKIKESELRWIKATSETKPIFEPVIVTVLGESRKYVIGNVVWNEKSGTWRYANRKNKTTCLPDDLSVTHWMYYPEPAED